MPSIDPALILKSLKEGIYVVDRDRKIVYWGTAAEKITGWKSEEIVGRYCSDDVLAHIDKDGHKLCPEEYCPLHRAMVTDKSSTAPIIVFALGKDGRRIPMKVSVAPFHDEKGSVVGGIETFYDLSSEYYDIERAAQIQRDMLEHIPEPSSRISFNPCYLSNDVVGGDFYAVTKTGEDVYNFMIADVAGHGVPAALVTMYLNLIWKDFVGIAESVSRLAQLISNRLFDLVGEKSHFIAALVGQVDLGKMTITTVGAGCPKPVLFHKDGSHEEIKADGLLFGIDKDAEYAEIRTPCRGGDRLLLFSDGATEIFNSQGKMLDSEGLIDVLRGQGYPAKEIDYNSLSTALLNYSDKIRFDDDVTLLEIQIS